MANTEEAERIIRELRIKHEADRIARSTVTARCREEAMSHEDMEKLYDLVYNEQVAKLTAEAE